MRVTRDEYGSRIIRWNTIFPVNHGDLLSRGRKLHKNSMVEVVEFQCLEVFEDGLFSTTVRYCSFKIYTTVLIHTKAVNWMNC